MEITDQIKENLAFLKYELEDITDGKIHDMIPSLGYVSFGKGTTYEDGTQGVLMTLPEGRNKYNNGVYMLRELENGAIVMETIVPNDRDKGALIQNKVADITNFITGMDNSDLEVFDYAEIMGFVVANAIIKPLAESLFPTDIVKRTRFVNLYHSRFLANTALIYSGSENTLEEGVNSEPYVVKMMIDKATGNKGEALERVVAENEENEESDSKSNIEYLHPEDILSGLARSEACDDGSDDSSDD